MNARSLPLRVAGILTLAVSALLVPSTLGAEGPDPLAAARSELQAGNWAAAEASIRAVLAADGENGGAWLGLGQALARQQKYEEARAALDRALQAGAPAVPAHVWAARTAAAVGDRAAVLVHLAAVAETGALLGGQLAEDPFFASLADDAAFRELTERMRPCRTPEHRQLDFWIGSWEVRGAGGGPPARSEITATLDGCAIREEYANGPYRGSSLNLYDPASGRWHQTWIDNQGAPLYLEGGIEGESMVLRSTTAGPRRDRITWTPAADGTVRQVWDQSSDGGETWGTVFDGVYRPARP